MDSIKKLPGLGDHGSNRRFAFAAAIYITVLSCTLLALVGALVGGNEDEPTVADVPSPTATLDPTAIPEPDDPMITESHINETVAFIVEEPLVRDAHISVEGDAVTIALQVDHAANEEHARDVLDSAVRWLASQVAMSHDTLDSPSSDSLGGIWDHYTLNVGAGPDSDTFYARGAKATNSPHITWD